MATVKAIAVNVSLALLWLLVWIGTMVGFGAVLHQLTISGGGQSISLDFYWDKMKTVGYEFKYKDIPSETSFYNDVYRGGQAFVACLALNFIFYLVAGIIMVLRMLGKENAIPACAVHALNGEIAMHALGVFWYFLAVAIYGGTVYKRTSDINEALLGANPLASVSKTATGYAYVIVCFFFAIAALALMIMIRVDSSIRNLVESGSSPSASLPVSSTGAAPASDVAPAGNFSSPYGASQPAAYPQTYAVPAAAAPYATQEQVPVPVNQ